MNDDLHFEPIEVIDLKRRKFPALLQLSILGGLLLILLGGALAPSLYRSLASKEATWIDATAEPNSTATFSHAIPRSLEDVSVEAQQVFVYDVATKKVLYQKDPDTAVPIASITKLMTALVAHELLADDESVRVPLSATRQDSASGLSVGDRLSTNALIEFSMLASSNDAAHSLATAGASAIAGDSQNDQIFVAAMNARAKELELFTLDFYNATGLDISASRAGAYGSARDVTFLMDYLLKTYPNLLDTTTIQSRRIFTNSGDYHDANNTNRVFSRIPQLLGSKTGFTYLAGGNLVIAFDAAINRPVIITVLGSSFSGRFSDILTLVEASQIAITKTE